MLRPSVRSLILCLALVGWAVASSAAGKQITVDFEVSQLLSDDGTLVLVVGSTAAGQKGKWRVRLEGKPGVEVRKGTRGRMTAEREALRSSGPATVGFKGSDEELQALVDWLGEP